MWVKNKLFFAIFLLLVSVPIIPAQLSLLEGSETQSLETSLELIGEKTDSAKVLPQLTSPKLNSFLLEKVSELKSGNIPLIVQFEGALSQRELNQISALSASVKYQYSIIPAAALSIDAANLGKLADLPFVKSIEYDAETKIVLAQSTAQIGANRIWLQYGVEGEGIKVAVLDTGIDNKHQDLQNVILERDFTGEGTDDENGHGTHVASTVAGSGAMSSGLNKGVAPKASLMDIKVLNRLGEGRLSDTIAGIQFAVVSDADIISMSLGAAIPCNGLDATSLAADAAVKQGVHVVVAAGNTGPLPGTIGSPGCAREVITVGAVDRLDNIAAFSSRGPTLDGRVKPDIAAPGVLILAAQSGGAYTAKSGTSMATPHVSGVIALILGQKSGLSPEQIKNVLMETALDLGQDGNSQGAGRARAYEAFIEATGLEPKGEDEQKAIDKSRDEENVEEVRSVKKKKSGGKSYYVVEGDRKNEEGKEEIVRIWVNDKTFEIEKVEVLDGLKLLWASIIDFFRKIIEELSSYFK